MGTWGVFNIFFILTLTPGVKAVIRLNKRPATDSRRKMVRLLVDKMLLHCVNPTKAHAMEVARRVVQKYPDSFEDRADEGFHSLATQLKGRIDHVNRNNVAARLRKPRRSSGASDPRGKASSPLDSYGCVSFQPDCPETETEETFEEKRLELATLFNGTGPQSGQRSLIDGLMAQTYYLQRKDITNVPSASIEDIQQRWPFLFWQRWICGHFTILTSVPVHTMLSEAFDKKSGRIMRYFENLRDSARKSVRTVLRQMREAQDVLVNAVDIKAPSLMLMLMAHFGEDTEAIFILADVSMVTLLFLLVMLVIHDL